jgi:hypothetical protein
MEHDLSKFAQNIIHCKADGYDSCGISGSLLARHLQHCVRLHFSRHAMQSNAVSKHKVPLLCIAFCGVMLASSHDAKAFALGMGDSHELGFLWPGIQKKSGDQNRATYLNHLLGMALGAINIANGQVYFRSNHAFESLPAAARARNGGGRMINLGTGRLYKYLFATYNGYGSEVWYVGNLSGIVTIPFLAGWHCVAGWTLFGTGSAEVPEGGVTVMLLGVALGVLALARRFLMR